MVIDIIECFYAQDTLLKVKGVMVDEKRHIRFADWSATDVSKIALLCKRKFLRSNIDPSSPIFRSRCSINIYSSRRNQLFIWLICLRRITYVKRINGTYTSFT